ncbi:MAG: hypothetical protein ACLRMZ_10825 [Blautia marasmi]
MEKRALFCPAEEFGEYSSAADRPANRIDTISNAMELRGFGKDKKRTWYMKRPFEKRDFVAIGVGVVLLVVSMTVTIRWGRFYNPFV